MFQSSSPQRVAPNWKEGKSRDSERALEIHDYRQAAFAEVYVTQLQDTFRLPSGYKSLTLVIRGLDIIRGLEGVTLIIYS